MQGTDRHHIIPPISMREHEATIRPTTLAEREPDLVSGGHHVITPEPDYSEAISEGLDGRTI